MGRGVMEPGVMEPEVKTARVQGTAWMRPKAMVAAAPPVKPAVVEPPKPMFESRGGSALVA